jgi:hypothetical protein
VILTSKITGVEGGGVQLIVLIASAFASWSDHARQTKHTPSARPRVCVREPREAVSAGPPRAPVVYFVPHLIDFRAQSNRREHDCLVAEIRCPPAESATDAPRWPWLCHKPLVFRWRTSLAPVLAAPTRRSVGRSRVKRCPNSSRQLTSALHPGRL